MIQWNALGSTTIDAHQPDQRKPLSQTISGRLSVEFGHDRALEAIVQDEISPDGSGGNHSEFDSQIRRGQLTGDSRCPFR